MDRKLGRLILAAAICLLSACATEYQPRGLTGGFSETALAPDTYKIVFLGNGFTDPDRANDYALLRAADLALLNGYPYFVILDEQNTLRQTTAYMPTTTTISASHGRATATTYGGQPFTINFPHSTEFVKFLKEKPADGEAFDAAFVQHSLKTKYGIK